LLAIAPAARAADAPVAIFEPVLAMHAALAHDSTEGVAAAATALADAAAALGSATAPLERAARALAAQPDLAGMRQAFGDVNKALVACIRAGTLALPDGVRTAYCPMARRQWLQSSGALLNPYYGSAMPSCGDFTD
jgi:hypothetical protein